MNLLVTLNEWYLLAHCLCWKGKTEKPQTFPFPPTFNVETADFIYHR